MNIRKATAWIIGFSLLHWNNIALACSVCRGTMSKAKTDAYLNITVFLGLLPVVMGTLIFIWIYRKYKKSV